MIDIQPIWYMVIVNVNARWPWRDAETRFAPVLIELQSSMWECSTLALGSQTSSWALPGRWCQLLPFKPAVPQPCSQMDLLRPVLSVKPFSVRFHSSVESFLHWVNRLIHNWEKIVWIQISDTYSDGSSHGNGIVLPMFLCNYFQFCHTCTEHCSHIFCGSHPQTLSEPFDLILK